MDPFLGAGPRNEAVRPNCEKGGEQKKRRAKRPTKKIRDKGKERGIMGVEREEKGEVEVMCGVCGSASGDEAKESKGLACGNKPSVKEVEDHERTHLPFRSWCKHCVMGCSDDIMGLHVYER